MIRISNHDIRIDGEIESVAHSVRQTLMQRMRSHWRKYRKQDMYFVRSVEEEGYSTDIYFIGNTPIYLTDNLNYPFGRTFGTLEERKEARSKLSKIIKGDNKRIIVKI